MNSVCRLFSPSLLARLRGAGGCDLCFARELGALTTFGAAGRLERRAASRGGREGYEERLYPSAICGRPCLVSEPCETRHSRPERTEIVSALVFGVGVHVGTPRTCVV